MTINKLESANLTLTLKCFYGFEAVLKSELEELGYDQITTLNRAVQLKGSWRDVYFLNLHSRIAISVLIEITKFPYRIEKDIFDAASSINWSNWFKETQTFSVRGAIQNKNIRNTHYPFLLVKDAIVDHFKEMGLERPNIDIKHPKVSIDLYVNEEEGVISLNTSGTPLFQRGYRQSVGTAPLNEVVAAGLIRLSGWDRKTPFYDPFCGSATLLIEAALLATGIPSNIERSHYAFKNLKSYQPEIWEDILDKAIRVVRQLPCEISGSDQSDEMVLKARRNLRTFSFGRHVTVQALDFKEVKKAKDQRFIITNPPYGERLDLEEGLYEDLGTWLKHEQTGTTAWIISSYDEGMKAIGLKPDKKIPLYNGDLVCSFRKFSTYDGSRSTSNKEKIEK